MIYKNYYIEELPDFNYNIYRNYDAWRTGEQPLFSCRSTREAMEWVDKNISSPALVEYPLPEELREPLYYLAPNTVGDIWKSNWDIAEFEKLHPELSESEISVIWTLGPEPAQPEEFMVAAETTVWLNATSTDTAVPVTSIWSALNEMEGEEEADEDIITLPGLVEKGYVEITKYEYPWETAEKIRVKIDYFKQLMSERLPSPQWEEGLPPRG